MKAQSTHRPINRFFNRCARALLFALAIAQGHDFARAATYQVGDTVTNFTFVARRQFTRPDGTVVPAGASVQLRDFAGRVVFFEWFAVWCPFCVAAAPQVEAGIVDWYAARNGNPHGVPVLHVAVNQEPRSTYRTQTDNFITQQGFAITVNDYDNTSTNKVRFMFQSSGQPIFAVINGVTNSPSHRPWQLLVNHLGYGDTDFNQELANFRAAIDQVQAPVPAPQLSGARVAGAAFEFTLQTQPGRTYRVQGSENLTAWTTLATVNGSATPILFRDTNAPPSRRFYRAVTP
jgi:thiol-disulfide isomerase/thioredoxin